MNNNKIQKIIETELQEAQYIGEDGGMCIDSRFTRLGAYRKMVARMRESCGNDDAKEFMEYCKPSDIGIAYLHLVTDENKDQFEPDTEWYVSYKDSSPYEVWVYYV